MQIKRKIWKITSRFFRIPNHRRKYSILFLLKLMIIGFYYYVLSFLLLCDEMWKRKPVILLDWHSVSLSFYMFLSQRDTPAVNLALWHKSASKCCRITIAAFLSAVQDRHFPLISGICNALISLCTNICPSVVTSDILLNIIVKIQHYKANRFLKFQILLRKKHADSPI
jgi:hypothetical protein